MGIIFLFLLFLLVFIFWMSISDCNEYQRIEEQNYQDKIRKRNFVIDYLSGMPPKELQKKYNISAREMNVWKHSTGIARAETKKKL
jgi:hypothetical protein